MNRRFLYLLVSLISFPLITLFPSICFSELKTVVGEYCEIYLGDMKNKDELEKVRKTVRERSIINGLFKLYEGDKHRVIHDRCLRYVIGNYLGKVVVVSHTEKDRKICNKVKITSNPEVIRKYLRQDICIGSAEDYLYYGSWSNDIDNVLKKKSEKINIGLIIEVKIPDLEVSKREQLENEQEVHFFGMIKRNRDKYNFVDRRHLKNILDEQKLSLSGITDSDTVKLGKILNLDIIVLRVWYEGSVTTKVLKVDTGEVLLLKKY